MSQDDIFEGFKASWASIFCSPLLASLDWQLRSSTLALQSTQSTLIPSAHIRFYTESEAVIRVHCCHVQEETNGKNQNAFAFYKLILCQLKPYAPLRSSDRRKIATNVLKDYGLEPPTDAPAEDANTVAPISQLRNKLFPENTSSAKFNTTLGPDLSPVNGIIYSGTHHDGLEAGVQRPLWVETDDVIFPTSKASLILNVSIS